MQPPWFSHTHYHKVNGVSFWASCAGLFVTWFLTWEARKTKNKKQKKNVCCTVRFSFPTAYSPPWQTRKVKDPGTQKQREITFCCYLWFCLTVITPEKKLSGKTSGKGSFFQSVWTNLQAAAWSKSPAGVHTLCEFSFFMILPLLVVAGCDSVFCAVASQYPRHCAEQCSEQQPLGAVGRKQQQQAREHTAGTPEEQEPRLARGRGGAAAVDGTAARGRSHQRATDATADPAATHGQPTTTAATSAAAAEPHVATSG